MGSPDGKCMGYNPLSFLIGMFTCVASPQQIFNFDVDLGFLKIGGLCMQPDSSGDGTVTAATCFPGADGGDHQKWTFEDGLFKIGGECLIFDNGGISLGECKKKSAKQQFEFESPLDGLEGDEMTE